MKTMLTPRLALLALLALVALTGCAKEIAVAKGQIPVIAGSLEGGPWLVEDLNGGGIVDNVRVDLTFDPGDAGTSRVAGRSGCNRFTGAWQQDGSTITLGPVAGTRMMCAPALMELEAKFLATLAVVTTVSYDETGAALLKAPDGRAIKIRKETK